MAGHYYCGAAKVSQRARYALGTGREMICEVIVRGLKATPLYSTLDRQLALDDSRESERDPPARNDFRNRRTIEPLRGSTTAETECVRDLSGVRRT